VFPLPSGTFIPCNLSVYPGAPSAAQQFLRITEILYHPSLLSGNTNGAEEFEFIELRNTSTSVTLDPMDAIVLHRTTAGCP